MTYDRSRRSRNTLKTARTFHLIKLKVLKGNGSQELANLINGRALSLGGYLSLDQELRTFIFLVRDTMPSAEFFYFCQIKISERMPYTCVCWTKSYFGGEKIVISRNIEHLSFTIQ